MTMNPKLSILLSYHFSQNRLDNTNNFFTFLCVHCTGMRCGRLTDAIVKILAERRREFTSQSRTGKYLRPDADVTAGHTLGPFDHHPAAKH